MTDNTPKLEIRITEDDISNNLTMEELIGIQRGDFKMIIEALSRFADGVSPKEAKKILLGMSLNQFTDTASLLRDALENAAADSK